MATAREFFSSAVLRDGRFYVIGGEDSSAGGDTPLGEIFDPLTNRWSPMNKPAAFDFIAGDASGCVLADGRVLLGAISSNQTAIWDPSQDSWVVAGTRFGTVPQTKATDCNEETWTLLPDGSVLAVETFWTAAAPNAAQKYLPEFDEWVSAGATPQSLALQVVKGANVFEIGPAILLPNGMLFAIGATGSTALYAPPLVDPTQEGTWFSGPEFPVDTSAGANWPVLTASDAPACLQPNGKVLCVGGNLEPDAGDYFSANATVLEYDPSNPAATLAPLANQPPGATNPWTWEVRFLLLPSGDILYSAGQSGDSSIYLYRPDGNPKPAWKPEITSAPEHLEPGHSYRLYGRQLNGLSQAVCYGDDAQMATNYPIVRLRNWGGPGVVYSRSFDHSSMAVATGSEIHHTHFTAPAGLPFGKYELTVIANGIPSDPLPVHVEREARRRRDREEHKRDHDHDEEIVEFEHDEQKYKDKDAKEAKEKEKDVKEHKEKDAKEKEKDCKEAEQKTCKEKEHKEFEQKGCKEKEHKEFEQKSCKEKDFKEHKEKEHLEHAHHDHRDDSRDYEELLHKIYRLGERLERMEEEGRRRHFIREGERPPVGERALRTDENDRRLGGEADRRREEDRRQHEAERRAHDQDRTGSEPPAPESPRKTPTRRPKR
jgi:Kelch motif